MNVYQYLLQKKYSNYVEIELHLHEKCNMNCIFCCQNHNDTPTDKERLTKKLEIIKDFSSKQVLNKYVINLMGGELLSDDIDDEVFSLYIWFVKEIKAILKGKEVRYAITTNLIFSNTERVKNLVETLKSFCTFSLGISYDPKLRPWSHFQLECIFKPNVEIFKSYIKNVSTVLHKKTIDFLLKENDVYLTYLYNSFELDFSYYVPKSNNGKSTEYLKSIIPSEEDLKNILFFLKEKYPNSNPVKQLLNNPFNTFQCCSKNRILIDAYNQTSNCLYLADKYKQDEFSVSLDKNNLENLIDSTVKRKECLSCEFFNKCTFPCFALDNYLYNSKSINCFLKDFLISL